LDLTDYAGRSIPFEHLDNFQRHGIGFEIFLQFISIPRSFEIVPRSPLPDHLNPSCHDGHHKHYEWYIRTIGSILLWLSRLKKSVRTILHAKVEDLGEGCDCMLKLMEGSLWVYQIEIWDWRRYNIPISTIFNATRQGGEVGGHGQQSSVRELNLYWRGEPDCFPGDNLEHLKPTTFPKVCRQMNATNIHLFLSFLTHHHLPGLISCWWLS